MYAEIKAMGLKAWTLSDDRIIYDGKTEIKLSDITTAMHNNTTTTKLMNGVITVMVGSKKYILAYPFKQKEEGDAAAKYILANYGTGEQKAAMEAKEEKKKIGLVYDLKGVRGRKMAVYEDRAVLTVEVGVGSFLTGNVSDGEKTIYYRDCIGVQFKKSGMQIGYVQLETASGLMNKSQSNFFNENTFTFDLSVQSNEKMEEVAEYIKDRVAECKNAPTQAAAPISAMDELKKLKELLDLGIVTQEEFDAKKKQLLGL